MYSGIDLGEAISISGSKAMADKFMAEKKADKASRERSRRMLCLHGLHMTYAVKISLCKYRSIGKSLVGGVNREITPKHMYL